MVFAFSFHLYASCSREFQVWMVPAKDTPTLKWDLVIRYSVLLVLDDDVPYSRNMYLFIWSSYVICYWVGLSFRSWLKVYYLMLNHELVLLIFCLDITNLVILLSHIVQCLSFQINLYKLYFWFTNFGYYWTNFWVVDVEEVWSE